MEKKISKHNSVWLIINIVITLALLLHTVLSYLSHKSDITLVIIWVVLTVLVIFLLIRYFRKSQRELTFSSFLHGVHPTPIFAGAVFFLTSSFALYRASSGSIVIVQLATLFALTLTAVGYFESSILGNRIQRIFGFHSYIKQGSEIYKDCRQFLRSVVSNWEISKDLEVAISLWGCGKGTKSVEICGLMNEDTLIGIFWRWGVIRSNNKTTNAKFYALQETSIRFTCNERAVLLGSSSTDEARDIYGFLHRKPVLSNFFKEVFSTNIPKTEIENKIREMIRKPYSDIAPFGLETNTIESYKDYCVKGQLEKYMSELHEAKFDPRINLKKEDDRKRTIHYVMKGLSEFLLEFEKQGWVRLSKSPTGQVIRVVEWL